MNNVERHLLNIEKRIAALPVRQRMRSRFFTEYQIKEVFEHLVKGAELIDAKRVDPVPSMGTKYYMRLKAGLKVTEMVYKYKGDIFRALF